jgi:hypothetical protein
MSNVPLQAVRDLVEQAVDLPRLQRARQRQDTVGRGESPDYAPLLLGHHVPFLGDLEEDRTFKLAENLLEGGTATPEMVNYPHYTYSEQLASPEVMLYELLWEVLSWARTPSDTLLGVRPSLAFLLPTCFGISYKITKEGTAWFPESLSLEAALDADVDDLARRGEVPRILEFLAYFRDNVPAGVQTCCPVAVGPITQTDVLLGTQIWTLFYDQPKKVRALIEKVTSAIIEVLRLCKDAIGEPMDSLSFGSLHLSCGGVKIGSDSMVMMSPDMFRDFVQPSIVKLCETFSGGLHHSCGYYPGHFDVLCETEGLTAINLGQPEMWNHDQVVSRCHENGMIYYGYWMRQPGQSMEEYLRRGVALCGPERNRAILFMKSSPPWQTAWPEPAETMDLWHQLQDEM